MQGLLEQCEKCSFQGVFTDFSLKRNGEKICTVKKKSLVQEKQYCLELEYLK